MEDPSLQVLSAEHVQRSRSFSICGAPHRYTNRTLSHDHLQVSISNYCILCNTVHTCHVCEITSTLIPPIYVSVHALISGGHAVREIKDEVN